MRLSDVDIARLFRDETTWRSSTLEIAVAVCLGESGGETRAFNGKTPDASYGLLQINMHGSLGPARRKRYGLKSNEDLYDPKTNVRVGYDIWKTQGRETFSPWGAFTNGSYRRYMDRAKTAVRALDKKEPMPTYRYDRPDGSYTQSIPPGTTALRYGIADHFGIKRTEVIRDKSRCNHTRSEHCECRGIDAFTTDPVLGREIFDFCVENFDLGIQAVIFRDREWGFGSPVERHRSKRDHFDHVHIGLTKHAAANLTRAQVDARLKEGKDWFDMATKEELKAVVQEVVRAELAPFGKKLESVRIMGHVTKNADPESELGRLVRKAANEDTG